MDLPLELEQGQLLADSFPDAPPGENTPTARALEHVLQGLPASTDDGPQHVLLATDGEPFVCFDPSTPLARDYAAVEAQAALARAAGVALHVPSLAPASGDFAKHLDSVAGLGGTGRALLPADGDALAAELEQLVTSAITCEVELDGTVSEGLRCDGSVTLAGVALECGSADGYRMVSASRMALRGAACDTFRRDPDAALSVTFPCDTFTPK